MYLSNNLFFKYGFVHLYKTWIWNKKKRKDGAGSLKNVEDKSKNKFDKKK